MIGLFIEQGPLRIRRVNTSGADERFELYRNPWSWHGRYNLVFLDQPAVSTEKVVKLPC